LLLNGVLLTSFTPVSWPSAKWSGPGWVALVAFWVIGLWQASRQAASYRDPRQSQSQQDLFIRAQAEYLRGRWVEAQSLLERLIREHPEDIESRLLLSSVFRRSGRIDLSRKHLRRLTQLPGATAWQWEINRELSLLDRLPTTGARTA
jgi:uncharacterized protein HemY